MGACHYAKVDGRKHSVTWLHSLSASKGTRAKPRALGELQTADLRESKLGAQVAKDEAGRVEDRARRVKVDRDKALSELKSLKERVAQANQNLTRAKASLEREDTEGFPSFDVWVAKPLEAEVKPSSTPPSFQPTTAPALPLLARSASTQLSLAHASVAPVDASIPIDLMDD
ncbi:hypothetical protein SLEP1_g34432 [Rubroshorea leprosula]|uniref:Uncharacterized protein n=1 Tax=Rubroshorea leprosula TaxID=152421 RepID=A0AAV5KJZ0_9ROSI|nr:hypothetical protein SLEP1_g34432 [Rubroshorea leprosula]